MHTEGSGSGMGLGLGIGLGLGLGLGLGGLVIGELGGEGDGSGAEAAHST